MDTEETRKVPRKSRWKRLMIGMTVILAVIVIGAGLGFVTASLHSMPSLKDEIRPAASSQIYDSSGKVITTVHSAENRVPVSINKIPKDLQNAFIAAEDARFYQHFGVDPRGILRAVWSNITDRGVSEGGSTITQQLAKNALLTQERTLKRKVQEAFLALQIEQQYSKREILELYLNQIYFGQGAYGVQSAAHVYFGKDVEELSLNECAILAGIPKSPNYYSPLNNLKASKERQAIVLEQMVKYEYITHDTALKARNAEIKLATKSTKTTNNNFASYFIDYVTQYLIDKYGADSVYKEGLKVYTTLDMEMQTAAEQAIQQLPVYKTDANGLSQPQGALVALDPHNGHIKAMVGGRGNDQFNRAVLAERQPGSAFKPFVYLAAIESGLNASTIIEDTPISFDKWKPNNYDGKFHGKVTMRSALENSLNIPTIKLAQQLGPDKPLYYAQQMGISTIVLNGATNDRNLAMSLGGLTRGVTPLEITSAYGVLANNGIRVEPVAVVKVVDRNGRILEQNTPKERAVVNEKSAYILTDILRGVMLRGTGTGAAIGRPAAGKTGTTDDYKDAWFVGYTPDLVASVWLGFDNEKYLNGVTGGTLPATAWRTFMSKATAAMPARDFPRPSGVTTSSYSDADKLNTIDPKENDSQKEVPVKETHPNKGAPPDPKKSKSAGDSPDRTNSGNGSKTNDSLVPPPPNKSANDNKRP